MRTEQEHQEGMVKALFDARVDDLEPRHRVMVKCSSCGHEGIVSREELVKRGVKPYEKIIGLPFKTRCLKCGLKRSVVDVRVIEVNDIPARMPER
jgi:hypothetical protein